MSKYLAKGRGGLRYGPGYQIAGRLLEAYNVLKPGKLYTSLFGQALIRYSFNGDYDKGNGYRGSLETIEVGSSVFVLEHFTPKEIPAWTLVKILDDEGQVYLARGSVSPNAFAEIPFEEE